MDDELANALYVAVVQPDTIWWDDLTPELQEGWRRGARAVRRANATRVAERLAELDDEILLMEPRSTFDACLVGVVERYHSTFALYSRNAVLAAIQAEIEEEVLGPEDDARALALEHFEFNVIGGWAGDGTPAYLIEEDHPA